jgi:uncharacterized membrane protein/uncharacterized membrane protein YbhN (UPF0104 family)
MAMNLWFKYKNRIRRTLTLAISIIVLLFFVKVLQGNWHDVSKNFTKPNWFWLFLAFLGFSFYYFFRIYAWKKILRDLGHSISFKQSGEIIMLSEFTRYVPGNIWSVLGRIGQSEKYGVSKNQSFYATLLEILSLLSASVVVGGIFSLFAKDLPNWFKLLVIIGAIGSIAIFWFSKIFKKLITWLLIKLKKPAEIITYSIFQNYQLLTILIVGWAFYAFGGLFLTLAFFKLNPNQFLLILAAMPIGWFLGYVSFITPSGIGIREASVAAILKASLGVTGVLVASFTRLGLTLVEFFWVIVFAWKYLKKPVIWLWNFIRKPKGVVILAILFFAIYFTVMGCLMHSKVITGRFDLGNMDQVVWNTSQGRFFQFTNPYGTDVVLRYIHHADLILVLFAPLYWIYSSPYILLIIQVLVVAYGGWLVFRLAKKILGHEWLSAVLALAYLFYPTLQRALMFDFHALTLGATFSLGMMLAYLEKRWKTFILFSILLAMCKEELVLMVATFGIFILWHERKEWRKAITIIILSLAYLSLNLFWLMPMARNWQPSKYNYQYQTLGNKPESISKNLLSHPRLVLSMVAGNQARHLYAGLLGSVAFLPVASPLTLAIAWPDFAVNLFNDRIEPRLLNYHYQATITGFIFISTIFGIAAIKKRIGPWWQIKIQKNSKFSLEMCILILLIITTAIESYRLSPLPYSQTKDMRVYWPAPMAPIVKEAIKNVPFEAKVSATNTVGAQLAHRQYLFQFPQGIGEADYIFILMAKAGTLEWQRNHLQAEDLAKDPSYKLIQNTGNFFFYRKVK